MANNRCTRGTTKVPCTLNYFNFAVWSLTPPSKRRLWPRVSRKYHLAQPQSTDSSMRVGRLGNWGAQVGLAFWTFKMQETSFGAETARAWSLSSALSIFRVLQQLEYKCLGYWEGVKSGVSKARMTWVNLKHMYHHQDTRLSSRWEVYTATADIVLLRIDNAGLIPVFHHHCLRGTSHFWWQRPVSDDSVFRHVLVQAIVLWLN